MADAFSALRDIIERANQMLLDATEDLTIEQTNLLPPGTANTIGQTYAHIIHLQDLYVCTFIQGQPTIWERNGWADRLGIPDVNRMSRESDVAIDPATFRPYAEQVIAATRAYLDTVDAAELTREVQGYRGPIQVADVLGRLIAFHALSHLGEIAALKGFQGLKGLPF